MPELKPTLIQTKMNWKFIWHLRGSVALGAAVKDEDALNAIERLLAKQRKLVTERSPDAIGFDQSFWRSLFGPNWLAMVIYGRGRFWIERGPAGRRLLFDLSSLQVFVICLLAATVFYFVGLQSNFQTGVTLSIFSFSWLYGMSVLLALIRVPGTVRAAISPNA